MHKNISQCKKLSSQSFLNKKPNLVNFFTVNFLSSYLPIHQGPANTNGGLLLNRNHILFIVNDHFGIETGYKRGKLDSLFNHLLRDSPPPHSSLELL